MAIITLTTDFGTRDYYAAEMRGVMISLAPRAAVVDITHEIEPFNILHGAFVLRSIWPWYPAGTIHVAVVDPGVGSDRRMVMARYDGRYILAPDNGLLTMLHRTLRLEEMRVIENRRFFLQSLSATFHGRDVLAPVAAYLASGIHPREFGRITDHVEILPLSHHCDTRARRIEGQVVYVDRFGNLITNIHRNDLAGIATRDLPIEVHINGESIGPLHMYFAEVEPGEPLAYVGSGDYLEIALNQGRAADRFGEIAGMKIEVRETQRAHTLEGS